MKQASFTGVILAGGASRRMGTDKAKLVNPQGECFITIMRRLLQSAGADHIAVLGRPDEIGGIADNQTFAGPVKAITDYLQEQPLGSKHLFVPIDMPDLTVGLLNALVNQDTWTSFSGNHMPFCAVAGEKTPTSITRIGDLLSYHDAGALTVPAGQRKLFTNLNHPQDFSRWQIDYKPSQSPAKSNYGALHHV